MVLIPEATIRSATKGAMPAKPNATDYNKNRLKHNKQPNFNSAVGESMPRLS